MIDLDNIADDEWIIRHVPGGILFQNPPDKPITSQNFRLREREDGLSVSRCPPTSPQQLFARLGSMENGSRIAACKASELRVLGLDVKPDPLTQDLGHALIVPSSVNFESRALRQKLAKVFRFVDEISELSTPESAPENDEKAGVT